MAVVSKKYDLGYYYEMGYCYYIGYYYVWATTMYGLLLCMGYYYV